MKVKELIEKLSEFDQDADVLVCFGENRQAVDFYGTHIDGAYVDGDVWDDIYITNERFRYKEIGGIHHDDGVVRLSFKQENE